MTSKVIYTNMPISELKPAPYNPRKDLQPKDEEYQRLKKSIEQFGFIENIVFNKRTGYVVGGHQRLKVLHDLDIKNCQVAVIDVSEEEEKALNIGLNKISGDWDKPMLTELLKELESSPNFEFTGFGLKEFDELKKIYSSDEVVEDDFDVDQALKDIDVPMTKKGDIWLLGAHRLGVGDATDSEMVQRLRGNNKVNLVVTDPPYNVALYHNMDVETMKKARKRLDGKVIQNDKMSDEEFYTFLLKSYKNMYDSLEDGGAIYVFHADSETVNFRMAFVEAGFKLAQCCIWSKNYMVMGRQDYHWQHEPVLYGWKDTASHNWYSDRKQTTLWNFDRPSKSPLHPTMKPLDLIAYPILNSSMSNCIVMDLFGGSGSTLISCEQTNRICYTMELDEKYADCIVQRYIDFKDGDSSEVYVQRDGNMIPYSEVKMTPPGL